MIDFNYQALKKLRKDKELTAIQLAEILGKTQKTISNWESYKSIEEVKISAGILIKLCNKFDLPIHFFFINKSNEEKTKYENEEKISIQNIGYQLIIDFKNDLAKLHKSYLKEILRSKNKTLECSVENTKLRVENSYYKEKIELLEKENEQLKNHLNRK